MGCIRNDILVVLLVITATAQVPCPCYFRKPELQLFFTAMNGPLWKSRWDFSDPDAPCVFPGVTCASTDVTMINLGQQGLSGQLPAGISNLTKLTLFNVSFNSITGTLPPEFAAWTSIAQVILEINNITGTLPPHYSEWGRSIRRFYCGRNNISGTLPVSYSNWSMIETFDGSYNQLNGSLPSEFAKWSSISVFVLTSNLISSTLPSEYAAWIRLVDFFVNSNNITGTLPPLYSAWGWIKRFYCGRNTISGTLPVNYSTWTTIDVFDVQYNQLSGSLPSEFAAWQPSSFTLNNNLISSTLPPQYSQWGVSTQYFYLQDCDIYGSLPPSYSNWTYLMGFAIRNSRVSGPLPNEYASWVRIDTFVISYSSLSGTIPSTYNRWSSVTTIDLSNNHLTGTIPSNIWENMTSLNAVALWNNSLTGTLPPPLFRMPKLIYLSVGFNKLSGTIPSVLSYLGILIVQNNSNLSGSIPAILIVLTAASNCGTNIQRESTTVQLYCFPHEMIYVLLQAGVNNFQTAIAPFCVTCSAPQPLSLPTQTKSKRMPLSISRTPLADDTSPSTPFDTFIPAYTAPQTLVAIASIVDPISGVALVALGNSRCAPQSMRSSTSTSRVVLSPFYLLGPGASVFGNIGLLFVTVAVHALAVQLYVTIGSQWHRRQAHAKRKRSSTPADKAPRHAALLRFPNISIAIVLHFARGTAFYGAQGFVGTDEESDGGHGNDSVAMRAGSATAGVLFLIGLVACVVYAEVSGLTQALGFQKYRLAVRRRWKWMPLWALPVGQWGPPEARHRLGPLRGSVTEGKERFAMLTAGVGVASSLLIGAFPSSAAGCVAQAIGQCALLGAAAVVMAVMRPLRISLSYCLLCATWAVQGCLNFSMAASRVWDSEEAVSATSVFTIVHVVLGLITTIHRCVIMYWERGVKPKTAFLSPNEILQLNSAIDPTTISPVRLPSQHRQRGRKFGKAPPPDDCAIDVSSDIDVTDGQVIAKYRSLHQKTETMVSDRAKLEKLRALIELACARWRH